VSEDDLRDAALRQEEYLRGQTVTRMVTVGDFGKKKASNQND
jgi:hypothetical protein